MLKRVEECIYYLRQSRWVLLFLSPLSSMYLDNPELANEKAEKTKEKREKIVFWNKPYVCKFCWLAKQPKDFVVNRLDNYWVWKYRYLYECKDCKKKRMSIKRSADKSTVQWAIHTLYKQIIWWNKKRNLDIDLDVEDILDLWEKQGWKCYYTWYSMTYSSVYAKEWTQSEKVKYQVSCDRLDPNKGYVKGNVVLCCTLVNKMKNILSEKEFYKVCWDIINNK